MRRDANKMHLLKYDSIYRLDALCGILEPRWFSGPGIDFLFEEAMERGKACGNCMRIAA